MKSALYLCLLLLGLQVQAEPQKQQIVHSPEGQSQADAANSPHIKLAPRNADFAFKFYKQIRDEVGNKNIFLSPLSISTAFAMLSLGARSNTLRELHKGLSFNLTEMDEQQIHEGFQRVLQLLNDPHRQVQLNMGNALFIDNQLELLQSFLDRVSNFYYSEAVSTNLRNCPEAMREINKYVETKTHGKIVDLVKDLDEGAMMGPGKNLSTISTQEMEDFFLDAKNSVKVQMMHQTAYFNVHRDEKLSSWVVEIPYKGNATSLFVLPDEGTMKQVEDALLKETVSDWMKSLEESLLEKMGVTEVFTDHADLSGVAKSHLLKVSKVSPSILFYL
uniref:Serpin domain-containing protein n=1 Tax=Malurus cyaneus samueli TaxID=2593467 RepID=A0A8C5T487_9PASS